MKSRGALESLTLLTVCKIDWPKFLVHPGRVKTAGTRRQVPESTGSNWMRIDHHRCGCQQLMAT